MKLLIASDIHGSLYYLEKLMDVIGKENPDRIVLLGDILYHGPRNDLPKDYNPKKVIEILNSIKEKLICVRGNCDTEVDQMVLDFPILSDYSSIFIDDNMFYLSHGHIYNKDNLPPLVKKSIFLSGHTHIPLNAEVDSIKCLNPGSVSIPKENSCHSYMIYENKEFLWKNIETMDTYMTLKI